MVVQKVRPKATEQKKVSKSSEKLQVSKPTLQDIQARKQRLYRRPSVWSKIKDFLGL